MFSLEAKRLSYLQSTACLLAVLASSCSSPPLAPSASASTSPSHQASNAPNQPSLQQLVSELRRASDVRNLALATDQKPPLGFLPLTNHAETVPHNYARAVAYLSNFDRENERQPTSHKHGCLAAISDDGTLCPSVVLPGVELTPNQVAELTKLLEPRVPRGSSCAARPQHSVVFYDQHGVPLFELVLNLRCGRSSLSPWDLDQPAREKLRDLCRELGLGVCFLGDTQQRHSVDRAFAKRYVEQLPSGATRLRPTATPLALDRSLDTLSPLERRVLCAWNIQHTLSSLKPGGEALQNQAGTRMRLLSLSQCGQQFPTCAQTLGDLLPCMSQAQRGAPVFQAFSEAICSKNAKCLWGFELGGAAVRVP